VTPVVMAVIVATSMYVIPFIFILSSLLGGNLSLVRLGITSATAHVAPPRGYTDGSPQCSLRRWPFTATKRVHGRRCSA
jgi:hypothetical protein